MLEPETLLERFAIFNPFRLVQFHTSSIFAVIQPWFEDVHSFAFLYLIEEEDCRLLTMATKLKSIIPAVPISQCQSFVGRRDDGQQLIRQQSVRQSTSSRRPKFSIRSKKSAAPKLKQSKLDKNKNISSKQQQPTWDVFSQSDPTIIETGKKLKKSKKRRVSFKVIECK